MPSMTNQMGLIAARHLLGKSRSPTSPARPRGSPSCGRVIVQLDPITPKLRAECGGQFENAGRLIQVNGWQLLRSLSLFLGGVAAH